LASESCILYTACLFGVCVVFVLMHFALVSLILMHLACSETLDTLELSNKTLLFQLYSDMESTASK
jgi:hypothetical protein